MNITKMSLVAALLIGSSAFALENTKVSGDANLYYQTADNVGNGELLDTTSSAADMSVNLNLTTDVLKNDSVAVSAGLGYTVLTTLGLEGQMVSGTWAGAHDATAVDTVSWVNEAWFATTAGKTTAKIGRMELDTPLAFTEKWSIEKNTFESAVVINQDVPDTTLVGAYIGRGNGAASASGTVATGAAFTPYGAKGAYAVGAINNSWKPLTAQAWYYDIVQAATATWLQADLDMSGVVAGLQYTTINSGDHKAGTNVESSAYAAMIGYSVKDTVTAKLSYSDVDTAGAAGANTATGNQSKLYTEAWWNYGNVTQAGAKSVNLTVEAPTSVADLGLYVTMIDQVAANADLTEYTASASKSMGPVDASLVYIHADAPETGTAGSNTVQVYLTANF